MAHQSKYKRAIKATALLDEVTKKLLDTRRFFKDDQTPLIAGICASEHYTDPRMVSLLGRKGTKCKQPMGELFKRMLAIRFLSMEYEGWSAEKSGQPPGSQYQTNRPANHGLCKLFIREQSLPDTSRVRGWFMCGQKLLQIEREVGIPGISLVLTCLLPKFPHFYGPELNNAIRLLNDGSYPDIIHTAIQFTVEFEDLQDLYAKKMGLNQSLGQMCIQSTNFARNAYVSPTLFHDPEVNYAIRSLNDAARSS